MRRLHLYAALFGWRVHGGPFRGMRYVRDSVCSALAPKLLGAYELELNPWIEHLLAAAPPVVINIGAAEGYYAVGFARRCAKTRVVAFESDPLGRAMIAELAARNGVTARISIDASCTTENLAAHLAGECAPLLIVDIEGGEIDLLDPAKLPALKRCPMLVELHEEHQPAGEIIRQRFDATHTVDECWSQPRRVRDLPVGLRGLAQIAGRSSFLSALSERRPGPMRWFLLEPKAIRR
ncbi:MAG TPA: hypothetical protein VG710_04235 [Opitutus sp.]|nr:hypothetical protein [Opitutus sp.]